MKQRIRKILIAVVLFVQLVVVVGLLFFHSDLCRNIIHPDFCSGDPSEPMLSMAVYPEMVYIKPGETKRIKLDVGLLRDDSPPPPDMLFYFGTNQEEAIAKGGNTLLVWANDQVIVSWDGVPFNGENAYLTISATKDAKQPPPNDPYNGSTGTVVNYAYLRAIDAKTTRATGVSVSIQVKEE